MTQPIVVHLPHSLGVEEAKRRMRGGIGKLEDHIPGGADVSSRWDGNRLYLDIKAMGQSVGGHIDVEERQVRLELMLPAFLALFAGKIEALLKKKGAELLEDKSGSGKGGG